MNKEKSYKILYLEDKDDAANSFSKHLELAGFDFIHCKYAEDLIKKLKDGNHYDGLFLDAKGLINADSPETNFFGLAKIMDFIQINPKPYVIYSGYIDLLENDTLREKIDKIAIFDKPKKKEEAFEYLKKKIDSFPENMQRKEHSKLFEALDSGFIVYHREGFEEQFFKKDTNIAEIEKDISYCRNVLEEIIDYALKYHDFKTVDAPSIMNKIEVLNKNFNWDETDIIQLISLNKLTQAGSHYKEGNKYNYLRITCNNLLAQIILSFYQNYNQKKTISVKVEKNDEH